MSQNIDYEIRGFKIFQKKFGHLLNGHIRIFFKSTICPFFTNVGVSLKYFQTTKRIKLYGISYGAPTTTHLHSYPPMPSTPRNQNNAPPTQYNAPHISTHHWPSQNNPPFTKNNTSLNATHTKYGPINTI